jgi:phospho-2-dehydro-3-deoxyheptonate aldolase
MDWGSPPPPNSRHHQLSLSRRSRQLGRHRGTHHGVSGPPAIGLRTALPRGFKNGTDGNIRVAIDAIQASTASHLFTAPGSQGGMVVIKSEGNPDGHIILRGGTLPNYHQSDVAEAADRLTRQDSPRLMVDCSHGNSQKLH